ncbi:MAG: DUF4296 domain-containing protein [Prevotellaceae bacterium]|jgi:uncharacterized protein YukE|nr:DUF4296 domain-containing protein [Prevotellaceae bacterium]
MTLKFKLILFVLLPLCLLGCKKNDILSMPQLENILFEMHLADGVFSTLTANNKINNADSVFRYKNIFEKYKCSRDKFEKSMRAYSRKKETIDKIYENVQKRFETVLKNYEGISVSEFTNSIINKISTPFKNIFSTVDKSFENIESFDDMQNKISEQNDNLQEDTAIDSAKNEVDDTPVINEKTKSDSILKLKHNSFKKQLQKFEQNSDKIN